MLAQRWILAAALTLLPGATATAAQVTYVFGVVPQQSAVKTARLWVPVLQETTRQSGVKLVLKTTRTIPEFEQRLRDGNFDFAYMNPQHYVTFSEAPGYRAIAKARNKVLRGILVVPKESAVQQLRELSGLELAFPAPSSFAASLVVREHLRTQGIDVRPVYVGSHDAVYLNVAQGRYAAGGGVPRTFANMPPGVAQRLRVLWRSPGFPPHAIAAHPAIAESVRDRVREALRHLGDSEAGRAALAGLEVEGFEAADDGAWDPIRALSLEGLQ